MSFTQRGSSEDVETLVDSLTTLNDANLSNLTSTDIQQLAELTQEMDTDEQEVIIQTVDEEVVEEVMQTDIGAQEIEIETERPQTPEEILPDVKIKTSTTSATIVTTSVAAAPTTTSLPPLRPLTIAPKPTKVPIAMKPVPGQQLLLLQGGTSNQAIKLVSTQGQELNLANIQIGRPVAIKPAIKTTVNQQSGNLSLVQSKQVVMKKIVTASGKTITKPVQGLTTSKPGTIMVMQKSEQVKLLPQSPTKTITLQQAQELGLITTTTKFLPQQAQSTPKKQTVLINKSLTSGVNTSTTTTTTKTIKLVPQVAVNNQKSGNILTQQQQQQKVPMKILPATTNSTTTTTSTAIAAASTTGGTATKVPQRIIFKTTGGSGGQTILPAAQIIQVAGTQALGSGQLHQINIPGKGMQYIKFVTATNAETVASGTITQAKTTGQNTIAATPTTIVLSEVKPITTTIGSRPLKNIAAKTTVPTQSPVLMLPSLVKPANIDLKPLQQQTTNPSTTTVTAASTTATTTTTTTPRQQQQQQHQSKLDNSGSSGGNTSLDVNLESNGMRPRKPCNCTKSQCLKLYCDCFANGEFCFMCNCMNCFNNLENEDHRQRAIKTCLERNPNAFRPKIGKAKDVSGDIAIRKHTKGCNCKRSGCLKNYCECYEAKIACSNNCKCVGCRNIEDSLEKKGLRTSVDDGSYIQLTNKTSKDITQFRAKRSSNTKLAINFITDEVIEAMSQCMLTISHSAENEMQDDELTKQQIIEEFGRCLTEIINYSSSHN